MGASEQTPCCANDCQVTMVMVNPPLVRNVSRRRAVIGWECWGAGWRSLLLTRWLCCKGQKWPGPKDSKQHWALSLQLKHAVFCFPHPFISDIVQSVCELMNKKRFIGIRGLQNRPTFTRPGGPWTRTSVWRDCLLFKSLETQNVNNETQTNYKQMQNDHEGTHNYSNETQNNYRQLETQNDNK